MSELGTKVGLAKQQLKLAEARNAKLGILRKIPLFPSRREIARLTGELTSLHKNIDTLSNKLKQLATARYYISRWFRLTGVPLCDLGKPGATAFGTPRYELGRKGTVRFNCKFKKRWKSLRGYVDSHYAEYETFCAIQRIVDSGALGHARLLANLIVPYDEDEQQRYNKHVRAHEIDAVLVTERSIVVVEVKNTWMAVTIDYNKQSRKHHIVRSGITKHGDQFGTECSDYSVSQVVAHCWTLADADVYSIGSDSMCGLVVYEGSPEIRLRCGQGEGRPSIYFAALNHNEPSLEIALRAAVFSHAPVRSPAEVDAVADELFARYADLDGSKLEAHCRRIERDTLIHRGSAPARKRTCKNRWTRDEELEHMMQVVRSQSQ